MNFDSVVARARSRLGGRRQVLGIVGPPGSGKSTLAEAVVEALGDGAALVPMDGFHLANEELERLGRRSRKGAPDTFDVDGYAALLRRLRESPSGTVYCPRFDRALEEPVAGAIPVRPEVSLVVTEGNYLLLDQAPWSQIRSLLDESWYVALDDAVRVERLVNRHVEFGKSPAEARAWVQRSDEANARLIAKTAASADFVVDLSRLDLRPR